MKTNVNKTNVSIKFNSIKEYREIESKLIELRCIPGLDMYFYSIFEFPTRYVFLSYKDKIFNARSRPIKDGKTYNTLEEFLNDN